MRQAERMSGELEVEIQSFQGSSGVLGIVHVMALLQPQPFKRDNNSPQSVHITFRLSVKLYCLLLLSLGHVCYVIYKQRSRSIS